MKPNSEQLQAIEHFQGPCLVTSVPGSGKTTVLTQRVMRLISHHNINPANICCLTFTNKASEEMRERVSAKMGDDIAQIVWIGTFHRFCLSVLRKYGHLINLHKGFSVYDSDDQQELMSKIARMHELTVSKSGLYALCKISNDIREQSLKEDPGLSATEQNVLTEYLQTLDDFNAVDFSGILSKCWTLLENHKSVVQYLSDRFKYILVDEVQDTNVIQYSIVKAIASHTNLFMVGDLNQSIFAFRGACPENMNIFMNDFNNATNIILPRNYRSTSQILEMAERLIKHNDDAKNVKLISERGSGANVVIHSSLHPDDEAAYVCSCIMQLKPYYNWKDFAVLYRTNHRSKSIEMACRSHQIPYKIIGGFSFFDRSEIKTALSYLSCISNPMDSVAFVRAISSPTRKVGESMIGKIERYSQLNKISIIDACLDCAKIGKIPSTAQKNLIDFATTVKKYELMDKNGSRLVDVCYGILKDCRFYDFIKEQSNNDADSKKRIDNLDEFLSGISSVNCNVSEYLHTVKTMTDFQNDGDSSDVVSLLTMHSAKGLEFQNVFVIGVESGVIPHYLAVNENRIVDERRLLYVALTRAKSRLIVTHCKYRYVFDPKTKNRILQLNKPSMFLDQMVINHGDE